jgi:hypothetical protein
VVAALIGSGALISACNVTPVAASANGATISSATLNAQLHTIQSTQAGACLLQLESSQSSTAGQGAGGAGTYTSTFAGTVLGGQVGELLTQQYAASKGITVSSAEMDAAKTDLESTLDGEIEQAVNQATQDGSVSSCESAQGQGITGAKLLSGLPQTLQTSQIKAQAYDEKLLAHGANLSPSAVAAFYAANKSSFTTDCVSRIVTSSQSAAEQIIGELNAGASFATLAKSSSIDTQTASNGGSLGCTFTEATVDNGLQQKNIPVGSPLAPVQQSGGWVIYEVASQTVEPLSSAVSLVERELLQSTSNVNRVTAEIIAFAHRSDVSVDPEYGTWSRLSVVPPVAPPSQYLLSSSSGLQLGASTPLAG